MRGRSAEPEMVLRTRCLIFSLLYSLSTLNDIGRKYYSVLNDYLSDADLPALRFSISPTNLIPFPL